MLRDQAAKANKSKQAQAITAPKASMKSAPRAEAISGRALSARHSGQLQTVAIQTDASAAKLSGFHPRGALRWSKALKLKLEVEVEVEAGGLRIAQIVNQEGLRLLHHT